MFLTAAALVITCGICYGFFHIAMWHVRRRRLYTLASKFEGPPVLPLIGNAHLFIGSAEHLLNKMNDLTRLYPSPVRVWLGPRLLLFVSDPEQAKAICCNPKTLGKGESVKFGRALAGNGLFTGPLSIWKVHRKLIQPTFNTKILNSFVEIFAIQSKIFTEQIERYLDGPEFEIFTLVSLCNLDMICETAMGVNVGAQTNRHHLFVQNISTVFDCFCKRVFSPWLYPDFIYFRTHIGKEQERCIKYLHNYTNNVVQLKKRKLLERNSQQSTVEDERDDYDSAPRRQIFLDYLLSLSTDNGDGSLSDEELRDEVNTHIAAGNDTTTTAGTFVLLMLASHPDVQEKVYQELHEIYGGADIEQRPVTFKDLSHMKYLERVIKETLRLFPSLPFFERTPSEEMDIGDITLPIGSSIIVGLLPMHRNEKYWPDPLRFDPDRFLPEEIAKRHPYAFLAFGGGPRNCIGLNYGMMAVKTLISTILRKYILIKDIILPIKDIRLEIASLLIPVDPVKLRIERRTRK